MAFRAYLRFCLHWAVWHTWYGQDCKCKCIYKDVGWRKMNS